MAISELIIEQIKQCYKDNMKEREICELTGVARNTVRKYKDYKNDRGVKQIKHFKQVYSKIKQEEHDKVVEMMRNDTRASEILDKILDAVNDNKAIKKENIKSLLTGYGILVDKAIRYEELEIKRQGLNLARESHETYKPENDNFKQAAAEAFILLMKSGGMHNFIEKDSLIPPEDSNNVQ